MSAKLTEAQIESMREMTEAQRALMLLDVFGEEAKAEERCAPSPDINEALDKLWTRRAKRQTQLESES